MQKEINSLRMSLDYKTEEFNKFKMKASIELELGRQETKKKVESYYESLLEKQN